MKKAQNCITRRNFLSTILTAATAFTVLPMNVLAKEVKVSLLDKLNITGKKEENKPIGDWSWLFNGKNINDWENVNCASSTWTVKNNKLICSGEPHGFLRTEDVYENYILELDWRLMDKKGNSGIFLHADLCPR